MWYPHSQALSCDKGEITKFLVILQSHDIPLMSFVKKVTASIENFGIELVDLDPKSGMYSSGSMSRMRSTESLISQKSSASTSACSVASGQTPEHLNKKGSVGEGFLISDYTVGIPV